MNPIIVLIFVIALLAMLFFSLFSLFKLVFFAFGNEVQQSFGDVLFSPSSFGGGNEIPVLLSAIFASVISVVIIIISTIFVIRKSKW